MSWTTDIETILNDLRENSVYLSNFHKKRYFYYKRVATYFRLPTICISAFASVASAGGASNYITQDHVSGIVCLMSLTVGILNSIELYLRIQDNLESELTTSKSYYALSIDLHRVLNLSQINRDGDPKQVLEEYYKKYEDLIQESNLLSEYYPDKLNKLPKVKSIFSKKRETIKSTNSSSSSSINSNPLDEEQGSPLAEL